LSGFQVNLLKPIKTPVLKWLKK